MRNFKEPLFERISPITEAEKQKKQEALEGISNLLIKKSLTLDEKIEFIKEIRKYCFAGYGLKEAETKCRIVEAGSPELKGRPEKLNSVWSEFETDILDEASKQRVLTDYIAPDRESKVFFGEKFVSNANAEDLLLVAAHEFRHIIQYNLIYEEFALSQNDTQRRFKNVDKDYLKSLKANLVTENQSEDEQKSTNLPFWGNKLYHLKKWGSRFKEKIEKNCTAESDKFDSWARRETEVDAEVSATQQAETIMDYAMDSSNNSSFVNRAKMNVKKTRLSILSKTKLSRLPNSTVKKFKYRINPVMETENQVE